MSGWPAPKESADRKSSVRGMRIRTHRHRRQTGFTLAEVLAALVFMSIVVPVALEGLMLANRAAQVAQRKQVATQLAENLLQELVLTDQWQSSGAEGTFPEPWRNYRWKLSNQAWEYDSMQLLNLEVLYEVQSREYSVLLSTLFDETAADQIADAEADAEAEAAETESE